MTRRIIGTLLAAACLAGTTLTQVTSADERKDAPKPAEISAAAVTVAARERGNPHVNFLDGKILAGSTDDRAARGAISPLALAAADFDGDGVDDLAVAYQSANGGLISVRRGNVESVFPRNHKSPAAPFLAGERFFDVPYVPDFVSAGDFDADGRADLLAARRGATNLILLTGTGLGDFSAPRSVELGGNLTAFAVGEMNNFDNLADVAVGISVERNPKVLIFQDRAGAFTAEPQELNLLKPASALAFGQIDARPARDLVVASGNELALVSGSVGGRIESRDVTRRQLDLQISSVAIGDFTGEAENEIAVLSAEGEARILGAGHGRLGSTIELPSAGINETPFLVTANVSTRKNADLIIGGGNQVHLTGSDAANRVAVTASFDATDAPMAVLPMRLNKDALADLVVLTKNQPEPSVLLTAPMSVLTVTNVDDSGGGSLRAALEAANASPGLDEIVFDVTDPSLPIVTLSDLPELTEPVTLDATTQVGFTGEPVIELKRDQNFEYSMPVLRFYGGDSLFRGFIVTGNSYLINLLELTGHNTFVEGNFIGTNRAGTATGGDGLNGISIFSSGNVIGGGTAEARNVISGVAGAPSSTGVSVTGGENLVEGNYVGTDKTGLVAVPNGGKGVYVGSVGDANVVGGPAAGQRNIVSGNASSGIAINPSPADFSDAVIENNFIGTNKNGDAAIGNGEHGMLLAYSAGDLTPTAELQILDNVISGNAGDGIYGYNIPVPGELASAPQVPRSFLWVGSRGPGNIALASGVLPAGNRIGTNAAGTAALPNTGEGIRLENFPSRIEGNIISANWLNGIRLASDTPFGNLIADNFIGTDATGTIALGNGSNGIAIDTGSLPVDDAQTTKIYDNVISANLGAGAAAAVVVAGSRTGRAPEAGVSFLIDVARRPSGNLSRAALETSLLGNRIGTNAAGTAALPNGDDGVVLQNAPAKIEGNLISGNGGNGIKSTANPSVTGPSQIADNYIGVNATGVSALANTGDGINLELNGSAPAEPQATKIWDNVISGNGGDGVDVSAENVTWEGSRSAAPQAGVIFLVDIAARRTNRNATSPTGNRIGTNAGGTAAVPNVGNGIKLRNAPARIENNLISGNGASGLAKAWMVNNFAAVVQPEDFAQIAANYIGTDVTGNLDLGNGGDGITAEFGVLAPDTPNSRIWDNVISGNGGDGVRVFSGANAGRNSAPQLGALFYVDLAAHGPNNGSLGALPAGNRIGTNAAGTAPLGNGGHGVSISGVPTKVGGPASDDGNIIAHNGGSGVSLANIGDQTAGNPINNNLIHGNAGLAIDLGGDGLTPNDHLDPDLGPNNLQNYPVLTYASSNGTNTAIIGTINTTPATELVLQFFDGLGSGPLGSVTVTTDAAGDASFNANFPVGTPEGRFITSTATTTANNAGNENNTSELSPGVAVLGPTAAAVTVAGRVTNADGQGIAQATVTVTHMNGASRSAITNAFGYFRFDNIAAGETHVFAVRHKRYEFAPRAVSVDEAIADLNFTAE